MGIDSKEVMKVWILAVLIPLLLGATFAALARAAHEHGRDEAIGRYRTECINADKKHERQFILLYVDEYRASTCDQAVRCIWSDCVKEP